jgi:uncharacterized protein (TIGR02996 family)
VTREEMLAAIGATPGDDAPRLVYADWLTQQGDKRGELIVVQCERARGNQERKLEWRDQELRRAHAGEWLQLACGMQYQATFVRGFVDEIFIDCAKVQLAGLEELLAREPVVRALRVNCKGGGTSFLQQVLASPVIAGIAELDLQDAYSPGFYYEDPEGTMWSRDTGYVPDRFHGDELAEALARNPVARPWNVTLTQSGLAALPLRGLLGSPVLSDVRALDLWGSSFGDAGIGELLAAQTLGKLAWLSVGACEVTRRGIERLAHARNLPSLRQLHVAQNKLDDDDLTILRGAFPAWKITG